MDIKVISRDELKQMLDNHDDFKLVNALGEWAFRAKHIPGSLHFATPEEAMQALDKDDDIVVYCSDVNCPASVAAYHTLIRNGYHHVRRYSGGLSDWEQAGYPLEGEWVS